MSIKVYFQIISSDASVGLVICYGLDGRRLILSSIRCFSVLHNVQNGCEAQQYSIQWVPESHSPGNKAAGA